MLSAAIVMASQGADRLAVPAGLAKPATTNRSEETTQGSYAPAQLKNSVCAPIRDIELQGRTFVRIDKLQVAAVHADDL